MYYKTIRKTFSDNGFVELDEDSDQENLVRPERNLLSSVLERAALDLNEPAFSEEAEQWFNEPDCENPEIMSFQYICAQLELDHNVIREAILVRRVAVRKRSRRTRA